MAMPSSPSPRPAAADSDRPPFNPLPDASRLPPRRGRPRLAVFGGSFNPIHNGHLFLAGAILRHQLAEEVLFIPAGNHPLKPEHELAPARERLEMLRLALAPYPAFSYSDIEIQRADERPTYTVETMETLKLAYPEHELLVVLGQDCLNELHLWFRAADLVRENQFLIYPRPGTALPKLNALSDLFGPKGAIKLLDAILDAPLLPVAASDIRAFCKEQLPLAGLVPAPVEAYLRQNKLYQHPFAPTLQES